METVDILYYFVMSLFAVLFLFGYGVICFLIGKVIAEKGIESEITETYMDHHITRDDRTD